MHLEDRYAIVVTERRAAYRNFSVRWSGFEVAFEASWFVYLAAAGDRLFRLAFMASEHPSEAPGAQGVRGRRRAADRTRAGLLGALPGVTTAA